MAITRLFSVILLMLAFTSCGVAERGAYRSDDGPEEPLMMSADRLGSAKSDLYSELRSAFEKWDGTPYVWGGSSLSGVDCSAFTQHVFQDHFERELPRHTSEQLQTGEGVRRRHIRTGDLLFFRTARGTLHVGIYMGGGEFLHASESAGVTISEVGEPYWATRYIGARRVL